MHTHKIKTNLKNIENNNKAVCAPPGEHQVCTRPLAEDSVWGVAPCLHCDFTIVLLFLYMFRD